MASKINFKGELGEFLREKHQLWIVPLGIYSDLNQPWIRALKVETVLDIGANTGQFTKAVHRIFPGAKIYAFEPLEDCCDKLEKLQKKIPGLEVINRAVGNREQSIEFRRSSFSPSSSILKMENLHKVSFPHTAGEEAQECKMIRLDDFFKEENLRPEILIKLDTQGYEDQVILGAEALLRGVKVIMLEMSIRPLYEGQVLFDGLYKLLTDRGFRFAGIMGSLQSPLDGSLLQVDGVFIKE